MSEYDHVLEFIRDFWNIGLFTQGHIVLNIIADKTVYFHFPLSVPDKVMRAIWALADKYNISVSIKSGDWDEVVVEVSVHGLKERDGCGENRGRS